VTRFLWLSAVLSVSAMASTMGTCTPTALSNLIGNPCAVGALTFNNFAYSGDVDAANINVDFQMAANGTDFSLILAPMTGSFLRNFTFSDTVTVAGNQIVSVNDHANFSLAAGSSGLLTIVNNPGAAFTLSPGNQAGGPTRITPTNSVTTNATLTGPSASADPGLSSFELGYLQANTGLKTLAAVPEPASFGLFGLGLLSLSLLRKRGVPGAPQPVIQRTR
jgi:PEP-CTERM motif-containing protein